MKACWELIAQVANCIAVVACLLTTLQALLAALLCLLGLLVLLPHLAQPLCSATIMCKLLRLLLLTLVFLLSAVP
jgi:hypothetical protein